MFIVTSETAGLVETHHMHSMETGIDYVLTVGAKVAQLVFGNKDVRGISAVNFVDNLIKNGKFEAKDTKNIQSTLKKARKIIKENTKG